MFTKKNSVKTAVLCNLGLQLIDYFDNSISWPLISINRI